MIASIHATCCAPRPLIDLGSNRLRNGQLSGVDAALIAMIGYHPD
jgi:hypothetical protein